uniref:ABC transporter permease n=1 Tax=Strongyloides papillosus TaxID=174720 RepID=A0A0N5BXP6_STREA
MHRFSLICSFVERVIATKYCHVYEKKVSRAFPFFLSILCIILSIIWILLSNKDIINGLINILLHISILLFSLLGSVVLLYQNKRLEKEYKRNLTERFIIKDNIRIAKFILPKLLITNLGEAILLLLSLYYGISMKEMQIARCDIIYYCLIISSPTLWNMMNIISKLFLKLNLVNQNNEIIELERKNEGYIYFNNLYQQWELI